MPADVAVRPVQQSHLLGGGGGGGGAAGGAFGSDRVATSAAAAALAWTAEEASGRLTLLAPGGAAGAPAQDVLARVYRTSLEHFVVLYPGHRNVSRPLGVLNLRNTRVEPLEGPRRGFTVRQRAPDAPHALTFLCPPEDASSPAPPVLNMKAPSPALALAEWLLAFTWRGSPTLHATPLPAVQEDEEV